MVKKIRAPVTYYETTHGGEQTASEVGSGSLERGFANCRCVKTAYAVGPGLIPAWELHCGGCGGRERGQADFEARELQTKVDMRHWGPAPPEKKEQIHPWHVAGTLQCALYL